MEKRCMYSQQLIHKSHQSQIAQRGGLQECEDHDDDQGGQKTLIELPEIKTFGSSPDPEPLTERFLNGSAL